MDADERRYREMSGSILGAAMSVANELGVGFLEKVYERAVLAELAFKRIEAKNQQRILVHYKGVAVGDYVADLIVEDLIIVELKCCDNFNDIHLAQCLNYLKATGHKLCLLINFAKPSLEWKRIVHNF